jgi:hypothetical protein
MGKIKKPARIITGRLIVRSLFKHLLYRGIFMKCDERASETFV